MGEVLQLPVEEPGVPAERYAHSLGNIRAVGASIVAQEIDFAESDPYFEQAWTDFISGVREMLRSDPEFTGALDIDDRQSYGYAGGKTRGQDGRSVEDMIGTAERMSTAMALVDGRYSFQAERDTGDQLTIERVDKLRVGQSYIVQSMPPQDGLAKHREIYRNQFGYKEGLMFFQCYTRVDENTVEASYMSVDFCDLEVWREVLDECGWSVPDGTSADQWIRYGFEAAMDADEAQQFARQLRNKYYQRLGLTGERFSVSEFVGSNEDILRSYFSVYYRGMSEATHTKQNNDVIRGFARNMLQADLSVMESEIRSHMMYLANGEKFADEHAITLDAVIRYAATIEMRKQLPKFMSGTTKIDELTAIAEATPVEVLHLRLVQNVVFGIENNLEFLGCSGIVTLSERQTQEAGGFVGDRQKSFGGRASQSEGVGEITIGECQVPSCTTRPRKVRVGGCRVCLERCQKFFNMGIDPTKMAAPAAKPAEVERTAAQAGVLVMLSGGKEPSGKPKAEKRPNMWTTQLDVA